MKIAALTAGLCALALAAAATAQADKKPERVLTKDELRTCFTSKPKLQDREKALVERGNSLQAKLVAVKAENDAMVAEQKTIKEDDVRMQIRFENKKKAFNEKVAASNTELETFQKDRAEFEKDYDAYNKGCTGVSYRNEDKLAIEKEMGTAK